MRHPSPSPHVQARGSVGPRAGRAIRGEILAIHRAIFRQNQTRINRSVFGYTAAFQRYEQEYLRGVRRYQRRASLDELDHEVARADVVYVGDYHTLPQAQRAFLRLLRRLPRERRATVGLELVQGRFQRALDAFVAGGMSVATFLRRIHHDDTWAFGGWDNFGEILELCRERGIAAIGIDSAGRGPAGASLKARDRYAAKRIADAVMARPGGVVMVLVGELHIAPPHLPRDVQAELGRRGRSCRQVVVYQNCHSLYWQLEARGLEQEVDLVRVAAGQYCLMNTPPIVCQQSFLNWLDVDEELLSLDAPEENFKEYARLLARFFDLPLGDALEEVEVTTVADLSFLSRLKHRGDFSATDMRRIRQQILRSDSYYIPRARMVYLGNLSVNHAAEEASHFLRDLCSGSHEPRYLVDAFYARCLEEAVGFLGSKLVNHKRKQASIAKIERRAQGRNGDPASRTIVRLVRRHLRMERGERVRGMAEVYECSPEVFNAVTHVLGYRLGERLYYALLSGVLSKQSLRELFFDAFDEEGEAVATYLYLLATTASVRIPDRF